MVVGNIKIERFGPWDTIAFVVDGHEYKYKLTSDQKTKLPTENEKIRYTFNIYEDGTADLMSIERLQFSKVWEKRITRSIHDAMLIK